MTVPSRTDISLSNPSQPFIDHSIALSGGQEWREYDISSYTNRFQPAANAQQAVRRWILAETGENVWYGIDTANLTVTPTRVRVYHNPQIQAKVASVLGRFLNYVPGNFRCHVRLFNIENDRWAERLSVPLQPLADQTQGPPAWLVLHHQGTALADALSGRRDGVVLADTEILVANGQPAHVRWSPTTKPQGRTGVENIFTVAKTSASAGSNESISLEISPLIASDGTNIAVDFSANIGVVSTRRQLRLPSGRQLLISLGPHPSRNPNKTLWRRDRQAELLVLLEIRPAKEEEPGLGQTPLNTHLVSKSRTVQPSKFPPPELTRQVF